MPNHKEHIAIDADSELITAVAVTVGNIADSQMLGPLEDFLDEYLTGLRERLPEDDELIEFSVSGYAHEQRPLSGVQEVRSYLRGLHADRPEMAYRLSPGSPMLNLYVAGFGARTFDVTFQEGQDPDDPCWTGCA